MVRILIADDHEVVRRGTRQIIGEVFHDVVFGEARNTQETVALLLKDDWDLLLLDINMPGRSGLEVLDEVKRMRPNTPVLIVSAYAEEEFALRSFQMGASGYLTKSSASDELVAAVKKLLAGGKYVTNSMAEQLVTALREPLRQMPHESLSQRELQVLQLVASGKTIKEIASDLSLSEKTIHTYRTRLSEKLHLSTNVELTRYAMQHHLVE